MEMDDIDINPELIEYLKKNNFIINSWQLTDVGFYLDVICWRDHLTSFMCNRTWTHLKCPYCVPLDARIEVVKRMKEHLDEWGLDYLDDNREEHSKRSVKVKCRVKPEHEYWVYYNYLFRKQKCIKCARVRNEQQNVEDANNILLEHQLKLDLPDDQKLDQNASYEFTCMKCNETTQLALRNMYKRPKCAFCDKPKKTTVLDDIAAAMEGICLTEEYAGIKATYTWKCKVAEHPEWNCRLDKMYLARSKMVTKWCPNCND